MDSDGDGLFDDDETGTDPFNPDSDGDGSDDGQEVYDGSDPLTPAGGGAGPVCAQQGESCAAATCCIGFCGQDDLCDCISDGSETRSSTDCCSSVSNANGFCGGACGLLGGSCNADADCCSGNYAALCCFDGTSLTTRCTDVTNIGFVCPGDPIGPVVCDPGLTNCNNFCVNLNTATFDRGFCGNSCGIGGACNNGVRGTAPPQPLNCPLGFTDRGGYCADLNNDTQNCGGCGFGCFIPLVGDNVCVNGHCECAQIACL